MSAWIPAFGDFFQGTKSSVADRQILQLAQGQFDVFITLDRGFEFQHNLARLSFGIVIVHPSRNRADDYESMAEDLLEAVRTIRAGEIRHIRYR